MWEQFKFGQHIISLTSILNLITWLLFFHFANIIHSLMVPDCLNVFKNFGILLYLVSLTRVCPAFQNPLILCIWLHISGFNVCTVCLPESVRWLMTYHQPHFGFWSIETTILPISHSECGNFKMKSISTEYSHLIFPYFVPPLCHLEAWYW